MARYDRIARIEPPERDAAFTGWLSLRDLEGREREPELGRRARLRYLAIRPVHRMLRKGLDDIDDASLRQQIAALRDELRRLPSHDPERELLEQYLLDIGGRSPGGLVAGTLDVGRAAEAGGHLYAAQEFYTTALELARHHEIPDLVVVALRLLGRVHRKREEWDIATARLQESALLAASRGSDTEWARGMEELAAVEFRRGDPAAALATLDEIEARPPTDGRRRPQAIAAAGRCAISLAQGDAEAALEAGWSAIQHLDPDDESRNNVLLNMGAAFRRLELHDGARSCYDIVRKWAAWPEHRIEAELELAGVAAEAGDEQAFDRWRAHLLDHLDWADRPLQALVWLGLGRAALLVGQRTTARDHLRDAVTIARDLDASDILERAEHLLRETVDTEPEAVPSGEPTPVARQIALRLLDLIPAG